MIYKFNIVLSGLLLAVSSASFSENNDPNGANNDMANLTTYLQNLGEYFGYDITQYCTTGGSCSPAGSSSGSSSNFSNLLLNYNNTYASELNLFNSYLGALLGGSSESGGSQSPMSFVTGSSAYSLINQLAGQTFTTPPYSSSTSGAVSVSPLIDQQPYQADPVSQAVLDILSTPNYTYCMDSNAQTFNQNCQTLFREKVMSEIIGEIQGTQVVFTPSYNQTFVSQLNTDTLISPLLYSTTPTNANAGMSPGSSGAPPSQGGENNGLTATTQAQQAANFVRYATGAVTPLSLPSQSTYDSLINQAQNLSKNIPPNTQAQAQYQLTNYITRLRTYAAQSSVGISNLYYILSRRLPQRLPGSNNPSSEALNEFIMASWRLYNPNVGANSEQWLTQINHGSAASVQKEIAILLAEINYQLYLTRQQQERMLLTNTMQLIQNAQVAQPDATLSSANTNTTSPTSGPNGGGSSIQQ